MAVLFDSTYQECPECKSQYFVVDEIVSLEKIGDTFKKLADKTHHRVQCAKCNFNWITNTTISE